MTSAMQDDRRADLNRVAWLPGYWRLTIDQWHRMQAWYWWGWSL